MTEKNLGSTRVFQSEITVKPAAVGAEMMCDWSQAGASYEMNGSTADSWQHPQSRQTLEKLHRQIALALVRRIPSM